MKRRLRIRPLLLMSGLCLAFLLVSFLWIQHTWRQEKLNRQLIHAVDVMDTATVFALLGQGADANSRYSPPISTSFSAYTLDLFHHLFSRQSRSSNAPTALLLAVGGKGDEMIGFDRSVWRSYLTEEGIGSAPDDKQEQAVVEALVEGGADPNVRDANGCTPLLYVARDGYDNTMQTLLDYHVDVNSRDNEGSTALMCFARNESATGMEVLIQHGAAIDVQDEEGSTALMWAVCRADDKDEDDQAAVRVLLKHGANTTLRCSDGQTALSYAERQGKDNLVHLLKAAGAKQ